MTMTFNSPQTPLRDALYAFSLAKPVPDAELLDEFACRYPEHAAALTDFAIVLVLDAAQGNDDVAAEAADLTVSPTVSRAMSRFQNRLFAAKHDQATSFAPPQPPSNPFAALDREAFRKLAKGFNANTLFVVKLRDRQIVPDTMTDGFRRCVANGLKAPLDVVIAHFAAQPQVEPRVRFKAEQKPEAGEQQTFEEAVRTSGLTEEQQRYLMSL